MMQWLVSLWKFSRPHTLIGTSLSVLGVGIITVSQLLSVVQLNQVQVVLQLLLGAWIPCLCGNLYIVGLNQLTDVGIDRINKPHLPLASGAFSQAEGIGIVVISGLLSLILAKLQGPYLLAMVAASLTVGTAYSLPPMRLKRFPFWAALCIFGVRGVIVNLGLWWHFQQHWTGSAGIIPAPVWALTGFIVVYTFAIAIFKDIPDLEGDRAFQIQTLTLRLGSQAVFNIALGTITICYTAMMIAAGLILSRHAALFIVSTHLGLLWVLWRASLKVQLQNQKTVRWFYQLIWKLFFLEYILFPLACLWG
jgi:homogentisate phytyltransferase / homogentisate geranylgeranyltransferase